MKKNMMWCLVSFMLFASVAWSQAQKPSDTEKAVAALEDQWTQGLKTNNPDLVAPLLADNWVFTDSEGRVSGKAEDLAELKTLKYMNPVIVDTKVIVHGNTAIAIGVFKSKMTDAAGKTLEVNERYTDTWMKMPGGKWQCIASHNSAIKQ
jgi:uncharacterized protein (TIGR02246 family)